MWEILIVLAVMTCALKAQRPQVAFTFDDLPAHGPLPPGESRPEVVKSIRDAGILDMQIFRTGNRLVMLMRVAPSFDANAKATADAANERVQAWEALMSAFQQPLPWAATGQKWVPMQRIFDLAQCPD